jgi:hypothetical protein
MTKPIKPDEVDELKTASIPDEVFAAFNARIAENWDGSSSSFTQTDVVASILTRMPAMTSSELFKKGWLDVEESYRAVGWSVEYDKPGYCEEYEATFTFKKKRKR